LKMGTDHWWGGCDRESPKYSEKNQSHRNSVHQKSQHQPVRDRIQALAMRHPWLFAWDTARTCDAPRFPNKRLLFFRVGTFVLITAACR
jgi:hypothetical protein